MNLNLDIIYEDDKMIVCNKQAGVLAQSSRSFDVDMVSALMTYRKKKGEDSYIGVINRLDRPVSGLMVFAKSSNEAAKLNKLMQMNSFNKSYYAIICGKPLDSHGTFVDYLVKDGKNNISKVVNDKTIGGKMAELEYHVEETRTDEEGNVYSLVRIHLITGRHHQIRVQFASRGMSLLGDRKYYKSINPTHKQENDGRKLDKLYLCAYQLDIGKQRFQLNYDKDLIWNEVMNDIKTY